MSRFESIVAMVMKGIEAKIESSRLSDEQLRAMVVRILDESPERLQALVKGAVHAEANDVWKKTRYALYPFTAVMALLLLFEVVTPKSFVRMAVDFFYPAKEWFVKIKPEIQALELTELPHVSGGIPSRVWTTVEDGDRQDFDRVLQNGQFYAALRGVFLGDLVRNFGTVANPRTVSPESVLDFGKHPTDATGVVVGRAENHKSTACGRQFEHDKLQAIIAIPASAGEHAYRWLGCDLNYPPQTILRVKAGATTIDGVALVGVTREAVEDLELRLSDAAAVALGISKPRSFAGKAGLKFTVSDAR